MFIIFKTENTATFKDIQCLKVIVDIQINTCVCCWADCVPSKMYSCPKPWDLGLSQYIGHG